MIDLHTHSSFSDGDLSPETLINSAISQGLRAIALTDHDTINGLESAKIAAKETSIRFIPGIEINISWQNEKIGLGPGGEFHLLGLGIKCPSPAFISAVDGLSRRREARNMEILDRIYELSMDTLFDQPLIDQKTAWDELKALAGSGGSLGRPHFANFLVKQKIVKNVKMAFARYLGVGKPLYVPKEGLSFEEAAVLIRESGGIPVLAHPISLYVAWGRLPEFIKILIDMGLLGLEAWHPTAKSSSCRRLETLGKSLGLYITEGSDFHGVVRPDRRLGYSGKYRKINDTVLELIPELFQG